MAGAGLWLHCQPAVAPIRAPLQSEPAASPERGPEPWLVGEGRQTLLARLCFFAAVLAMLGGRLGHAVGAKRNGPPALMLIKGSLLTSSTNRFGIDLPVFGTAINSVSIVANTLQKSCHDSKRQDLQCRLAIIFRQHPLVWILSFVPANTSVRDGFLPDWHNESGRHLHIKMDMVSTCWTNSASRE